MGRRSTAVCIDLDVLERALVEHVLGVTAPAAVRDTLRSVCRGAFCVFDFDLRFVFAEGDALEVVAGACGREVEGSLFDDLLPLPPPGLREAYESALGGQRAQVDVAGEASVWEVHTAPVVDRDGLVIAGLSMTLDVTEERYVQVRMRRKARGQLALTTLSRLATEGADLEQLLQAASDGVAATLEIDGAGIQQIDAASGDLVLSFDSGGLSERVGLVRLPMTPERRTSLDELVAGPDLLHDVSERVLGASLIDATGASSVLSALIGGAERTYGTLHAVSVSPREFNEQEAAFVQAIANILWNAIERSDTEETYRSAERRDETTGLASRTLMLERLERMLERPPGRHGAAAILLVDLDSFNVLNDAIGRDRGDELLRTLGARLETVARDGDTVARMAGDEFALVCDGIVSEAHALDLAERVAAAVREPIELHGRRHVVRASIGVTVETGDSAADAMLRDADVALHAAKQRGGGCIELFSPASRQRVVARMQTESELYRALERDEMRVHYQPFFSLPDRRLIGMEALVRWEHPERGLVPPGEFIPLAEQTGLIVDLGAWVLQTATRTLAGLLDLLPAPAPLIVSVNVSARQLRTGSGRGSVIDAVERALGDTGLPPSALALEITESTLMGEDEVPVLHALKDIGVQTMLDDFGTGHSSLGRLSNVPLDVVKIDRCFVSGLGDGLNREPIVAAIIAMAGALGLRAIAEGVEKEREWASLVDLGCDAAQGFGLARPMPIQDLVALVRGELEKRAA